MNKIVISGWQEGFQKIPMIKLIRAYTGYGLDEGKHSVDDILEERIVVLDGFTNERAAAFVAEAGELGAVCEVQPADGARTGRTVILRNLSDRQAEAFAAQARAIGADCEVRAPEPALAGRD